MRFVGVDLVHAYSSNNIATVWKISRFILSDKSDFYTIDGKSIALHTFVKRTLISLSVNKQGRTY